MFKILSRRDSSAILHTLDFHRYAIRTRHRVKLIINYAVSHNVRHLDIYLKCRFEQFPRCLFSCCTLTSLKLSVSLPQMYSKRVCFPNSLNLPASTSLSLKSFCFRVGDDGRVEPFSTLNNLNTSFEIELSAPSLITFNFKGIPLQKLRRSNGNLSTVKHVSFDVDNWLYRAATPLVLLNWLVELASIESLTITSTTLQALSLVPDLLKSEFSSLCNLKLLKVKKKYSLSVLDDGLVEFLLQNSPSAEVKIVDY
ncbi:uncharacterized protein LOC131658493 [Vicia villosa]|uniref:uncharacterized protein LOC131658493 n=1 Tax=Vicia villosa TaxID=3911 RepID=UPI00273AB79B|nr:uncharacterized protein LOC131658493 [Vicia villosa]